MIELIQISKEYPAKDGSPVHALVEVSVSIAPGEFVAVVGTSGSGKSTLLNILGLLDRPSRGRYHFAGEDLGALSTDAQAAWRNRRFGFVFQAFHLLPRSTAVANVELPLHYSTRREISGMAAAALASVGLGDRLHHLPSELSGGQQQRVAVARALVNKPELILADEPTGNLDARSTAEIMEIFADLHRAGRTIVLVTHDEAVAAYAERRLQIEDGRLVRDEPTGSGRLPATGSLAAAEARP